MQLDFGEAYLLATPWQISGLQLSSAQVLMALQAGLPILEFSEMIGVRREEYFAAVRAGLDMNYQPMKTLYCDVIERSLLLSLET